MIIPLNVETENTYYKIFETIKYEFSKLDSVNTKKGRPCKYSDEQIVACAIYGVRNSIFSLKVKLSFGVIVKLYKFIFLF